MPDIRTEEGRHAQAVENVGEPDNEFETEQSARAVARLLGADEEMWRDQIPVLVAVEEGRLKAVWLEQQTPEWREGFRDYIANR